MEQTNTLRPGLLVSLKTGIAGNVSYRKTALAHSLQGKTDLTEWETLRKIADVEEHRRAVAVRSDATYTVKRVCADTAFGLLCAEENADKLTAAIAEARSKVDAFNREARITRLTFYVITGRVEADDAEAIRSIRSEVASMMIAMERGVQALNADAVRDAAKRARAVATMLSDDGRLQVERTVALARDAASKIAAAARAGESAAGVIDAEALASIIAARTSFLDLDDDGQGIVTPVTPGRALDLETAPETEAMILASDRAIDLD